MKAFLLVLAFLVPAVASVASRSFVSQNRLGEIEYREIVSSSYQLDRLYLSMTGPSSNRSGVQILPGQPRQLLWLTGLSTKVVTPNSTEEISPEFFCHANLTFDPTRTNPARHNAQFANRTHADWRLFTLVPGRLDLQLPSGFGVPIYSDTSLDYFSMSLNQNVTDRTVQVQFVSKLAFQRDAELKQKPRALYRRSLYVLVPIAAGLPHPHGGHNEHPGEGCGDLGTSIASGDKHPGRSATAGGVLPSFGDGVTIHWLVPPGEHEYRTAVTDQLKLAQLSTAQVNTAQVNTAQPNTVHYATAHLHPYGKELELFNLTTGHSVFSIRSKDFSDRIGVAEIEQFSSTLGVPINPEHQFELRARYFNPTSQDIDAMAILYLYLEEPNFVSIEG